MKSGFGFDSTDASDVKVDAKMGEESLTALSNSDPSGHPPMLLSYLPDQEVLPSGSLEWDLSTYLTDTAYFLDCDTGDTLSLASLKKASGAEK